MDQINVAIIGCGRVGSIHARNLQLHMRESRVTACVDPLREQARSLAWEIGVEQVQTDHRLVLDDPGLHAVVVSAPTEFHRDIAVAAAEAGKHVFCEKPLARSVDECHEILNAVKKYQVKLQMGFMRRYDKSYCEAKAMIDSGAIGQVVMVRSLTYGPSVPKSWMYDLSRSNGPLSEVNSHDIDTLRWFTGSEIRDVFAIGGNFRCPDARKDWPGFYDNVVLTARFENGMQGCINGAQGVGYGYDARCEILGTSGIVFAGSLESGRTVKCTSGSMTRPVVRHWPDLFDEAYQEEARDFVRCILEDNNPKVNEHDGLMAVKVVNAGNRSIREGVPFGLDKKEESS